MHIHIEKDIWGHSKKVANCKPWKEASEDNKSDDIDLGLETFKNVKKNVLVKSPSVWYFVMTTLTNTYKLLFKSLMLYQLS